jgi:hypothetical protein
MTGSGHEPAIVVHYSGIPREWLERIRNSPFPLAIVGVGNAKVDCLALQPLLILLAMSGDIARPASRETSPGSRPV